MTSERDWPELPYDGWKDTYDTLHMWIQMPGKVKLKLAPFWNEWWEVALQLTARGLTTGPMPYNDASFDITFDFVSHNAAIRTSEGKVKELPLMAQTVARFYDEFMTALRALDIDVSIDATPSEVADPIPFDRDTTHRAYDSAAVERWWRVMLRSFHVFERWRSPFVGKSSPVQFFWGSFDLNATRFSGKFAPPPAGAGTMMAVAEDEENFAAGFWPGDARFPHAAYYSYAHPQPDGITSARIQPSGASFDNTLGEFVLPYDVVRRADSPEEALLQFLRSTYEAAADLGKWDRQRLERTPPPGVPS